MEIFYIIAFLVLVYSISWVFSTISNSKKYLLLKPKLDLLEQEQAEFELKISAENEKLAKRELILEQTTESVKSDLERLKKQKTMGFPWLAEAYVEYFALRDLKREKYLETKKHPALTAAQTVREIKQEKKTLLKENKVISYKLNYLEKIFPWISDLISENEEDDIPVSVGDRPSEENEIDDGVKKFLSPEEYQRLPSVERNQKALDRYIISRNKSNWALGRDYEMYVGYLFQEKGYRIEYKGILDGYEDLGRDIIAKKEEEVCIIQCKNWAQFKSIHEKHVFQLFGTTMEYWIKNFRDNNLQKSFQEFSNFLNDNRLKPIFFTSTSLSSKAKEMASALSIEIVENTPLQDFPRIKCNLNVDEFGNETRIYHLPMDQQYDRTVVGNKKGEFYALTVKEAEDAGFRRAFKHRY